MLRTLTATLLLAGLFSPLAAEAQGRFELTPRFGYRLEGEISEDTIDFDSLEVEESETYGVSFGIPLNDRLHLEFLVNQQPTDLVDDGGLFSTSTAIAEIDVTYAHVGVAFEFGLGPVQPFVVGSIGLARLELDGPGLDDEDRFSASAGGGVKLELGRHFGLRFEGRGYITDLGGGSGDDDGRFRYDDDDTLIQAEVTAGLILAF